jgi:PAS domain S-box-containing protein/putative nucleotidyltransferase with HDIG domain
MNQDKPENSKYISQTGNLWQHIFNTQQAGIVVSINGIIQQMNSTAVKMLCGQSSSDFIGKRFHETLISSEYIECTLERERQLRGGQPTVPPIEIRVRHLNGGESDALISATSWFKENDIIVESMLIDITPLKQRERLLEAISGLMAITMQENFFTDAKPVLHHALNAMHKLYAEHHNCGYVGFSLHENGFLEANGGMPSPGAPLLISYEPLSGMARQWILDRGRMIAQCEPRKDTLYTIPIAPGQWGSILLAPLVLDNEPKGYFFWIFAAGFLPEKIEADAERRNTFVLAALTTVKIFLTGRDNARKSTDLAILHRATLEIGKMNSLQQIADVALEILEKEKGWHPSVIRFRSRAGEMLETAAYRGSPTMSPEENRTRMDFLNKAIDRPGKGMIGFVIEQGKPIRSLDLPSDTHYIETAPGIKYGIYAPIVIEGNIEGAIGVESKDYSFTESDLRLLSSTGEIVGMTVRSLRLIEMLRERVKWLEILHQINQQIGIEAKPEELYQILVNKAIEATGAESAALLIYNPAKDVLQKTVARGWLEKVFDQPLRPDESISGKIFSTGQLHLSPLVGEDPWIIPRNRKLVPSDRANIGVPVVAEGTVLGVFHIAMKAPAPFSREFVDIVEMFGSYAGIVIGRMQLIEALRNADRQMQTAYDETLEGWARAIGLRDDDTLRHTMRVVKIAVAIGKHLNLDSQSIENLRRGALLHDVGKIGIPDTILRKPGPLNDEETAIMQTHTSFGYELLRPIKYLEGAIAVPNCHHERWDGTGYPRRLRGEKIPLLARIFAVADVYDAMTSDRPYRPAHRSQEAIDYVRSQSGRHFDPHTVEAFLAIIDRIEE